MSYKVFVILLEGGRAGGGGGGGGGAWHNNCTGRNYTRMQYESGKNRI